MASRWFVERDPAGSPAVSFERLAERWAAGELTETDRVRSDGGDDWIMLEDVIGLRKIMASLRLTPPGLNSASGQDSAKRAAGPVADTPRGGSGTAASEHPARPTAPRSLWQVAVPLKVLIPGGFLLAAAGWVVWRWWYESRRFPQPLHERAHSGWNLPWIGPVSSLEAGLLAFDCLLLIIIAVWWRRGRRS